MVNDTEPRYRLVDGNGNVVGSLFAEADGTLKLQEGTSGSDNEVSVATDGTFSAPAVDTDELYNDEESNLDISRYDWRVLTASHYRTDFVTSIDGWGQSVSGSGTVSLTESAVTIDTGTTSGSTSRARLNISANTLTYSRDWGKSRVFDTGVHIRDAATDRVDYIGWGGIEKGSEGIGFKIANGDLLGVANDGTSETAVTLITGVGTGGRQLRFEHDGGTEARFFVDGTQEGSISSGLPSGVAFSEICPVYYVENTSGVQRRLDFKQFQAARAP